MRKKCRYIISTEVKYQFRVNNNKNCNYHGINLTFNLLLFYSCPEQRTITTNYYCLNKYKFSICNEYKSFDIAFWAFCLYNYYLNQDGLAMEFIKGWNHVSLYILHISFWAKDKQWNKNVSWAKKSHRLFNWLSLLVAQNSTFLVLKNGFGEIIQNWYLKY